jgi:hypothetical protein
MNDLLTATIRERHWLQVQQFFKERLNSCSVNYLSVNDEALQYQSNLLRRVKIYIYNDLEVIGICILQPSDHS